MNLNAKFLTTKKHVKKQESFSVCVPHIGGGEEQTTETACKKLQISDIINTLKQSL